MVLFLVAGFDMTTVDKLEDQIAATERRLATAWPRRADVAAVLDVAKGILEYAKKLDARVSAAERLLLPLERY
jgi:hypothetical protein